MNRLGWAVSAVLLLMYCHDPTPPLHEEAHKEISAQSVLHESTVLRTRRADVVPVFTPPPEHINVTVKSDSPKLRWWEKKNVTSVATALTKKDYLYRFHALLGRHIPKMNECKGKGLNFCLPRIGMMRGSIDRFLRRMITQERMHSDWWPDRSLCWVATIMIYSDNLEKLHAFVGKQLRTLSGCSTVPWRTPDKDPDCAERLTKAAWALDAYFKKIVNDHGGPLIHRNWEEHFDRKMAKFCKGLE